MDRWTTKMKFYPNENNDLVGFVAFVPDKDDPSISKIRGVSAQSELPKSICVIDYYLKKSIEEGVLYEVVIQPMIIKNGYKVVEARSVKFVARAEINYHPQAEYQVIVKFGNACVYYDRINGRTSFSNTRDGVIKYLRQRKDIANIETIIAEFNLLANEVDYKYDLEMCQR